MPAPHDERPRPLHRLGEGLAVLEVEIMPVLGDGRLLPQPFHRVDPLGGQIVALVVVGAGPGSHLRELAAVGARHHVQPGPPVAHLVERRQHLGGDRRVLQQRVHRGPDLHPRGLGGERRHQHQAVERALPVMRGPPIAAELGHRHHEVEPDLLGQQGGRAVVVVGAVETRRGGGQDPPAIGDRQEDPEILAAMIGGKPEGGRLARVHVVPVLSARAQRPMTSRAAAACTRTRRHRHGSAATRLPAGGRARYPVAGARQPAITVSLRTATAKWRPSTSSAARWWRSS